MFSRVVAMVLAVLALSSCRITSEKELAALKSPINPHLAGAAALYHSQIVPQIVQGAQPLATLLAEIAAAGDFEQACRQLGYRAQPELPCHFNVEVSGEILAINRESRNGRLQLQPDKGGAGEVEVQLGPVLRGTALRDGYRGLNYADFNDQTLFGDFAKTINAAAVEDLAKFQGQVGDIIRVYGVFTSWQLPDGRIVVTPVRIEP